jgi:uncharacterized SAM-binding protein YcdF (DUF218 family)
MFLFKKLIGPLLFPFPFLSLLLITGLALVCFTRKQKTGKWMLFAAAVILVSLSFGFTRWVLLPLEQQYQPLLNPATVNKPESPIKWIVVLGGGGNYNPQLPSTSQLAPATMTRLTEGIRLQRQIPGSKLILSEGSVLQSVTVADVMANVAQELGVAPNNIILEKQSQDTEGQAQNVQPVVGIDPFILVTSASHMPRSMALFRKAGTNPIAAPTDFRAVSTASWLPSWLYPNAGEVRRVELGMHEYMGLVWAKVRGKI